MDNPVLVEVTRGRQVESRHRGTVAVVDASGTVVFAAGDTEAPVYPRSAIKVLQALPLVETGAADRFGFGNRELALACASHSGEEGHVALAANMLSRAGLGEANLECGCHWPSSSAIAREMVRKGIEPTQLHNNCSGKHSGFLCTAVHENDPTEGYVRRDHVVQDRVRQVLEDVMALRLDPAEAGVDGCSIPTYAVPVRAMARGFARLVGEKGVDRERAQAARRLIGACMAEPWYMAGTGRADVSLMESAPGRVFVKTGAEGVYCGAVPELGLGFALKIDDGASRASEAAVAATLSRIFEQVDASLAERFAERSRQTLRNWRKLDTGNIHATM